MFILSIIQHGLLKNLLSKFIKKSIIAILHNMPCSKFPVLNHTLTAEKQQHAEPVIDVSVMKGCKSYSHQTVKI